jgi:hypothetical protein
MKTCSPGLLQVQEKNTGSHSNEARPKDRVRVLLMDDDTEINYKIDQIGRERFGWEIVPAKNKEEVRRIAYREKDILLFILDAHMGKGKENEGNEASSLIKEIRPDTYVVIISAHPKNIQKAGDFDLALLKTLDLREQIEEIHKAYVRFEHSYLLQLQRLVNSYNARSIENDQKNLVNIIAYERLRTDSAWLKKFQGHYVVFVDGNVVVSGQNLDHLLDVVDRDYPYSERFFAQITHGEAPRQKIISKEPRLNAVDNDDNSIMDESLAMSFDFL